jgi:Arc/MetJ-type ribon-helix-helix transcriptional regulator
MPKENEWVFMGARIDQADKEQLEQLADKGGYGKSTSDIIREAIKEYITHRNQEGK